MSTRLATLRGALQDLIGAVENAGQLVPPAIVAAANRAEDALAATAFVAPFAFPARFGTAGGATVTLIGLHDGQFVGGWTDGNGETEFLSWVATGHRFSPYDPDPLDLVMPECGQAGYAPEPDSGEIVHDFRPGNARLADQGIVTLPILGRIS